MIILWVYSTLIHTNLRSVCPLGMNPLWACFFLWLSANLHNKGWEGAGGKAQTWFAIIFITASSFYWKESEQKFFLTQSSRSYLDKFPIEVWDHCITLLCCVHPNRGEDKAATMTQHQIGARELLLSLLQLSWYPKHLLACGYIKGSRSSKQVTNKDLTYFYFP